MKKNNYGLFAILLLIATSTSIHPTNANFSALSTISDAYYTDLDQDGLQDDVRLLILLELVNNKMYTNVDLYVGLKLPSGTEYWFLAEFVLVKYTTYGYVQLEFDLLNTATETGWYEANTVGFAGNEQFSYMDSLVFDPPGSKNGDAVTASFRVV